MSAPHWTYRGLRRGCAVLGILLGELLALGPLAEGLGLAGLSGLPAVEVILAAGLAGGLVGMWSVDAAAAVWRALSRVGRKGRG